MSENEAGEVTRLLLAWTGGDEDALPQLLPLVYEELRLLAVAYLSRERSDHTLQATDLVHETYLRLVDQRQVRCQTRHHFFAVAAQAMRRVLIDYARRHLAKKRDAGTKKLPLDDALAAVQRAHELIRLDDALDSLAAFDPQQAKIVELRFFGGLTSAEIGKVLGISVPTVTRNWRMARAWLQRSLTEAD